MIAQDFTNSIGSIIRIHKNGEYPKDNPFIKGNNWLPELFQIGVRNPQGMTLDPQTKTIYISNHGPKGCLLYTSPSPRDKRQSRMPSSA